LIKLLVRRPSGNVKLESHEDTLMVREKYISLHLTLYIPTNVRGQVRGTAARIFDPERILLWPHL